jgi:hypothetical protein
MPWPPREFVMKRLAANRKTLESDLIVDAFGNGSLTVAFLKTTERRPPAETSIGVNTRHASALFEGVDIANDYKGVFTFPDAPEQCRRGLILPAENHRHQVVLTGRGNDIPPIDGDEFLSYARTLSTLSVYNARWQRRGPLRYRRYRVQKIGRGLKAAPGVFL